MQKLIRVVRDVTAEINALAVEAVEEGLKPRQVARRLRCIRHYYLGKLSEISRQFLHKVPSPEIAIVQRFVDELALLAETVEEEETPEDVVQEYLGYWTNALELQYRKVHRGRK
ncbi:MAG: hypothetical protein ACPLQP_07765 [Moorellaceae bacterium]